MTSLGFTYKSEGQSVIFFRHGQKIKQIKELKAKKFIEFTLDNSNEKIQIQIAKITGNYKRGNERKARIHPRNKS